MTTDSPYAKARDLLDEQFGLGVKEAHQKIATDPLTSAIYNCALSVIARLLDGEDQ